MTARASIPALVRRQLWIILVAIVLITPFVLRAFVSEGSAPSTRIEKSRLIVLTPHAEPIRTEFADAFSDWHQKRHGSPVFVDYRIYGGSSDIVRYFELASALRMGLESLRLTPGWSATATS